MLKKVVETFQTVHSPIKTAATKAAPLPDPSVDNIKSNL